MPESGMGYQVINVKLKNGQVLKKIIVLNSEDLILPPDYEATKMEDIEAIEPCQS